MERTTGTLDSSDEAVEVVEEDEDEEEEPEPPRLATPAGPPLWAIERMIGELGCCCWP
jgi:hypothetical protein